MTLDATTPPSGEPASGQPDAGAPEPQAPKAPLTAEEVQAEWQNRMSQRDKAHAAETKALRDQLSTAEAERDRVRSEREQQRLAGMSDAERVAAERDALAKELADERTARVADVRRAKYAAIANEFDDSTLVAMDEAKLASLNERLAGSAMTTSPPSLIDPNSAARTASPSAASPKVKTKEELIADLKAQSPSFVASLGEGQ